MDINEVKRAVLTRQHKIKAPVETTNREELTESRETAAEKQPVSISSEKPGSSESQSSREETTTSSIQKLTKNTVKQQPPPPTLAAVQNKLVNLKAKANASKVAQTAAKASSPLDLTSLSEQPMTLQAVLKGNEDKLTSLVEIGTKTYVIKSGAGYTTIKDHITNTDIIRHLGISGFRAPVTVELNDDFRAALETKLGENNPAAKQLLEALGRYDQISEKAPGLTIQAIFDNEKRTLLKSAIKSIEGAKSADAAMASLKLELDKTLNDSAKGTLALEKKKGFDYAAELADPKKRTAAINHLMDVLKLPKSQQLLQLMADVSKQSPGAVVTGLRSQIANDENVQASLVARMKTKEGASALGALGLTDILDGMDDRIIGDKFNGGNFLFDEPSNDLWGIDNAKDLKLGLSSPDDQDWKTWFLQNLTHEGFPDGGGDKGEGIGKHIHWAVYTRETNDKREFSQNVKLLVNEEDNTRAGMDDAVTNNMQTFRALVNDTSATALPKATRDRLKARLDFVDARTNFVKLLNFDEFTTIPTAQNPWLGTKIIRKVKAKVVGTTNEQQSAETWKNQARNPNTTDADLDTLDDTVTSYLGNNPNADQRVLKALFAVRSERFLRSLKANTAALKTLPTTNKAWGKLDPAVTARVKAVADSWATARRSVDDKPGAAAINLAMTDYALQLAAIM